MTGAIRRASDTQTMAERGANYALGLGRAANHPCAFGWHLCDSIENLGSGWGPRTVATRSRSR